MVSEGVLAHALELFEGLGDIQTRKMFGGAGLYHDGKIFAVVLSDDRIMLKGEGAMKARFEALGMERWGYQREGKKESFMPYWALTDEMLDDAEASSDLAREALGYL